MSDLLVPSSDRSDVPDLGPLAWALPELRHGLGRAWERLDQAVSALALTGVVRPEDEEALADAVRDLHQAAGVLELVGEPMAARQVRCMESLLGTWQRQERALERSAATAVEHAIQATLAYLDSRLQDLPTGPVVLFATHRELLQLLGAPRIHPADLWPAPAEHPTLLPPADAHAFAPDDGLRRLFDRFVLLVLQAGNAQAARQLSLLCAGLAKGSADLHTGTFWVVAAGFGEAIAERLIGLDVYVKRALSRLLQQYIAMAQGHPEISDVLWHDLLFFCAQAQPQAHQPLPCLRQVREAYGLTAHVPVDLQQGVLGRHDAGRREALRAPLRDAKTFWELHSSGHMEGGQELLSAFARLVSVLVPLQPSDSELAQRLSQASQLVVTEPTQLPRLAMDVATALLYLEAAVTRGSVLDADWPLRLTQLEQRLKALLDGQAVEAAPSWMESLYRQAQERSTIASVVAELKASLADVERQLELFLRGDRPVQGLAPVLSRLDQMRGVMGVLSQEPAQRALQHVQRLVRDLDQRLDDAPVSEAVQAQLSANMGALSFLVDTLQHQPVQARELFVFDEGDAVLRRRGTSPVPAPSAEPQGNTLREQVQRVVQAVDDGADVQDLRERLDVLAEQAALADHPEVAQAAHQAAHAVVQDAASGAEALLHLNETLAAPLEPAPLAVNDEAPSDDMDQVFLAEAKGLIEEASAALVLLRQDPADGEALTRLRRAFHTLKGSARMVGWSHVGGAAWAVEGELNDALATPEPVQPTLFLGVDTAIHGLDAWLLSAAQQDAPTDASADWLAGFLDSCSAARGVVPEPTETGPVEPLVEVAPPACEPAPEPSQYHPPAAAPAQELAEVAQETSQDDLREIGPVRVSIRLYNVFLDEADTWSRQLLHALDEWALQSDHPLPVEAGSHAHALAGSAATVGFAALADLAHRTETALDQVALCQWGARQLPADTTACLSGVARELRAVLHQFAAGVYKEPQPDWLQRIDSLIDDLRSAPAAFSRPTDWPLAEATAAPRPAVNAGVHDRDAELHDLPDPALFPVFEEEAQELMPRLVSVVRQWVARPDNRSAAQETLRLLHTLKGSARLAGALLLGERVHELESQVQAATPEDDLHWLQSEVDELVLHVQRLSPHAPDWLASPPELPVEPVPTTGPVAPQPVLDPQAIRLPQHPGAGQTRANRATIRVASELLDRLVNETGEVMISRARVQGELAAVRGSLADLNANLERLRLQLRDMELQTETQMQSRLALARDTQQSFDPLEFDRFTRVQEITRGMAESVSDVATVQRQLQRAVDGADDQLQAQARQSRNLQRELLSTRLVEFEAMAERLYRVVRQASKDSGKPVRLDIVGGRIEMDRGTLDRLSPAFEHVLRNAVAHGIEPAERRLVLGKPAEGRIAIELTQVGNDVNITVSDDGAGLDTVSLAQRAERLGLPVPTDQQDPAWNELVFVPGLSTASELSTLAGRGVGMDVVRHDITALGGRVQLQHQPQLGCQVQMTLPLTTAITQVVVMRAGEHVFGVPAALVELVRRFDGPTLRQAHAEGVLLVGDDRLELFWAGALLRHSPAPSSWLERGNTCVLLRSAGQRVALHVDEVLGSQEVVVKKLGAQLSGVPGLTGMSILGSGAVALIHNPVVLARLHGEDARAYARSAQAPIAPVEAAPAVVSRQPLVLVVDDSITVRRVTQRLLVREGYRVALAADGLQALELLQQESPAAVLCDIEMPRMDGFDLVRNLRGDARWAEVPVIMITSRIADKHRQLAMSLGANHYLGKPYPEDELLGLLARYTRRAD